MSFVHGRPLICDLRLAKIGLVVSISLPLISLLASTVFLAPASIAFVRSESAARSPLSL